MDSPGQSGQQEQYYLQNIPVSNAETYKMEEAISAFNEMASQAEGRHAMSPELPIVRLTGPVPSRL